MSDQKTTPNTEETKNTTPATNAPDANVENNGDAANATPNTTDANATDAKADVKPAETPKANAKKEDPKATDAKAADAKPATATKAKAKTFVCEAYPDLLIKHGSDTILFAGGKYSTDDANLIEIVEKSSSYKSGQIVEA